VSEQQPIAGGSAATSGTPGSAAAPSAPPPVALAGVSKRFGATQALLDVSLDLLPGEIHGLVGENGAGKSTIVKVLAGIHQPDSGAVLLDGKPVLLHGPAHARALGIATVHQEPRLFPDLTVAENVFMGHSLTGRFGSVNWGEMRRSADRIFDSLSVRVDSSAVVRGLSMADQQLIEIAKALSVEARVLVLDEPTASLSSHEVERLFAIVRQTRQRGVAVLFVSHRLEEVFDLCDRATVLRDGRHVITAPTSEFTAADLVRHMVGRSVSLFPRSAAEIGDTLLEVRNLTRAGEFSDISFSVRSGEIVGLAGLVGAGRSEVARVLFGLDRADKGEIWLDGKRVNFSNPSAALHAGIAYVPEDRHLDGLVEGFSIAENVTLPIIPRLFPRLFTNRNRERKLAAGYAERLRIRSTGMDELIESLSGGNQQKVVIAKWLATNPRVLILDEPTRGVDIATKVQIYKLIAGLAAEGVAIMLISSEIPELLGLSHRIHVVRSGRVVASFDHGAASAEEIFAAAANVHLEAA